MLKDEMGTCSLWRPACVTICVLHMYKCAHICLPVCTVMSSGLPDDQTYLDQLIQVAIREMVISVPENGTAPVPSLSNPPFLRALILLPADVQHGSPCHALLPNAKSTQGSLAVTLTVRLSVFS